MDVAFSVFICYFYMVQVNSVPPNSCLQNFKWEDCGMAPKAVIYYYKSGSRCEVGLWRGCLPNPNMFVDEYECVQTCIFALRVKPEDFHDIAENEIEETTTAGAPDGADNATENAASGNGTGTAKKDTGKAAEANAPDPKADNAPGPAADNAPGPAADNAPGPAADNAPGPAAHNAPGPAAENAPDPAADNTPESTPVPSPKE